MFQSKLMRLSMIVLLLLLQACYHPLAKFRFGNWVEQNYPGQFRILSTVSDWNEGTMDTESYTVTFQSIQDADLIFSLPWRTDQEDGSMSRAKFEGEIKRAEHALHLTRKISELWRKEFPKTRLNLSVYPDQSDEKNFESWRHSLIVYQYSSLSPGSEQVTNSKTSRLLNTIRDILPNQNLYINVHYFGEKLFPEKENPLLHPFYTPLVTTEYVSKYEEFSLEFSEIPKKFKPEDIRQNIKINSLYSEHAKRAEDALFLAASTSIPKSSNQDISVLTPVYISLDEGNMEHWKVSASICKVNIEQKEKYCLSNELYQINCEMIVSQKRCQKTQWEKVQ